MNRDGVTYLMDLPGDVVFRIHYNGIFMYDPLRLDIDSGGLKMIESDADVHALYDLAEKHVKVDMFVAHVPQNLVVYYHKTLCLDGSDEEVTSKKREHDKRNKQASNMSVEELIAWAGEEAKSPYLRSPPLKSRPFRNDMKGKVLFTDMYYVEDEGFEMTTPLNDDEVGMEDLLLNVSDLENDNLNDAAKILDGMSARKNDASKCVEYTESITDGRNEGKNDGMNQGMNKGMNKGRNQGMNEGMNQGMNEGMDAANNDLDEQVVSRGNGISIRENDSHNVVLTDSKSDYSDHAYNNSESDSDQSDKSFDYLSDDENVDTTIDVDRFGEVDDTRVGLTLLIRENEKSMEDLLRKLKGNGMGITDPFAILEDSKEKYPIYDDLTHWKLKKPKLGEKFPTVDKFKECLTYYALANGFSLYFERSNKEKIVAKCGQRKEVIKDPSQGKQRA
ncbi:hypothetical protein Tco_0753851 [Tanacetum coccineum]